MSLLVPFDGSDLAKTALARAAQFDGLLDEGVIAVTVVPKDNAAYARERGWIGDADPFDAERIVTGLRAAVAEIDPDAEFRYEAVDRYRYEAVDRYAPSGGIARVLRRVARDTDTTIAFVGSENAGRIATGLTVGSVVSADRSYDTMIVNSVRPNPIEKLEHVGPSVDSIE
jgi:nucleotide-binding universal stress UspA family protein